MIDLKVSINGKKEVFEPLESVLHAWLNVIREYTFRVPKAEKNDYAWWYSERPQVGFLAIAAWLNGWAVLEEWGTEKRESYGRNDLWIGREKLEYFIEAKYRRCYIHEPKTSINIDIQNIVSNAKLSAAKLTNGPQGKRIAAAFISPIWHPYEGADFDAARQEWINLCIKAGDAVAMLVPDKPECPPNEDNDLCVGSALLLCEV